MPKVWVTIGFDQCNTEVCGVFSSEELAEAYTKTLVDDGVINEYKITECILDECPLFEHK